MYIYQRWKHSGCAASTCSLASFPPNCSRCLSRCVLARPCVCARTHTDTRTRARVRACVFYNYNDASSSPKFASIVSRFIARIARASVHYACVRAHTHTHNTHTTHTHTYHIAQVSYDPETIPPVTTFDKPRFQKFEDLLHDTERLLHTDAGSIETVQVMQCRGSLRS